jgi:hypothetical protein
MTPVTDTQLFQIYPPGYRLTFITPRLHTHAL